MLDDKWTLERLLGVGGMAAVYAARHRNGARAAIKVLHPHLSRYKEVRERFQREGYAANQVDHPGAVKVLDDDVVSTGPEAGTAYIVMELLEGQSMQDRLERGPSMSELEFLGIADRVLDVLCAAHGRGVVHRDLKPENLFLVREDAVAASGARIKVLDFGLARLLQGQAITTYGLALGTPSFMSPEQAAGRLDEIDGRTDLFALAATGFRLRTGRRIHEGANAVDLVTKMANLPAPPIRTIAAEVSEPFARVVDRALAFRREDRYDTAADMQADVRRAIGELDGFAATRLAIGVGSDHAGGRVVARLPEPQVAAELPEQRRGVARAEPRRTVAPAKPRRPVRPPEPRGELPTMEVSDSDLEPASFDERAGPPRPGHRSILPWVTAALFVGIGARMWLDGQAAQNEESREEPPASPVGARGAEPPSGGASPLSEAGASTSMSSALGAPALSASAPHGPSSEPAPSANGAHHGKPLKSGSGKPVKPVHPHACTNPRGKAPRSVTQRAMQRGRDPLALHDQGVSVEIRSDGRGCEDQERDEQSAAPPSGRDPRRRFAAAVDDPSRCR